MIETVPVSQESTLAAPLADTVVQPEKSPKTELPDDSFSWLMTVANGRLKNLAQSLRTAGANGEALKVFEFDGLRDDAKVIVANSPKLLSELQDKVLSSAQVAMLDGWTQQINAMHEQLRVMPTVGLDLRTEPISLNDNLSKIGEVLAQIRDIHNRNSETKQSV